MGRKNICLTMMITLAVGLFSWQASAGDKPALFRADPGHSGVYDTRGSTALKLKWRFKTRGKVRSTPAVSGGIVCFGSEDGNLYALSTTDGKKIWAIDTLNEVTSSPAISEGQVYFVGGDGNLYKAGLKTGEIVWRFKTGDPIPQTGDPRLWDYFVSSPNISNGVVYFGAGDGHLYAVDSESGAEKWRYKTDNFVRSTPAVADGRVYVGGFDGALHAMDSTSGELKWKFPTTSPIQSSPAVVGGTVYFGSRDTFFYALDGATGGLKWKFQHPGSWIVTSPAVSKGLVIAGSSDGCFLQALDSATGEEKWRLKLEDRVFSSPAIAEDVVYVGTHFAYFHAIDLNTGKKLRQTFTEGAISSSPSIDQGVVYVGCDDSCLYAFEGQFKFRTAISLDVKIRQKYSGRYRLGENTVFTISPSEKGIFLATPRGNKHEFLPESAQEFFMPGQDVQIKFVFDDSERVVKMVLVRGGQPAEATKIE